MNAPDPPQASQPVSSLTTWALAVSAITSIALPLGFFLLLEMLQRTRGNTSLPSTIYLALALLFCVAGLGSMLLSLVALGRVLIKKQHGKRFAIPALLLSLLGLATNGFTAFIALWGSSGGGMHGRPLRLRGRVHRTPVAEGHAWRGPSATTPAVPDDASEREALAQQWLNDAREEHASIAVFARVQLDLLALGAPPSLLVAAQQAGLDEVRHAQDCFALASAYGGVPVGPGPFGSCVDALPGADEDLEARFARVACEALLDGCVGEGAAAAVALCASREAVDPCVRGVLETIARDERAHAELGWSTVAWVLSVRPGVRGLLDEALDARTRAFGGGEAVRHDVDAGALSRHGRLSRALEAALTVRELQAARTRLASLEAPALCEAA